MGSYQQATGYSNFSINGSEYSYVAGAASGASGQSADPAAMAAAFYGILFNTTIATPQSIANAACSYNNASNDGDCATVGVGTAGAVQGLVSGQSEYATIVVLNNTRFNLSTSPNLSDQQCWVNGTCQGGPTNAIPPVTASAVSGSVYTFVGPSPFEGPSGAIWVSVNDPGSGALAGGMCIAFSSPVSGSNAFALGWNQSLSSFNTNSSTQQSSTLPAANGFPALTATGIVSNTSGSMPVIFVVLTQSPLPNGILVQVPPSDSVFQVILGQTCGIPDPTTAQNLFGGGWPTIVQSVSQQQFNAMPTGPTLTPGACILGVEGSQSLFLYTGGALHGITSWPVFAGYGYTGGGAAAYLQLALIQAMPQGIEITE